MQRYKIMSVFGTRPEAIKMAPLVKALEREERFISTVVTTAQHREMLDQVLRLFDISPKYDLNIMQTGQSLSDITCRSLKGLEEILKIEKPNIVLVHGDTTTTLAASLAAYYQKIPVGHVEAGLRSGDMYSPFPEELNRKLTGSIASLHFAPTQKAAENLLKEGAKAENIFITGNTVIDALLKTVNFGYHFFDSQLKDIDFLNKRILLVTTHRRENHGEPMENIFRALLKINKEFSDTVIVFPVHKNPLVHNLANKFLKGNERIKLIEPLNYESFANLMNKAYLVLTDSGGLQEEAPALGKPVLVLRNNTERPEAVEAGTVQLVGTETSKIYNVVKELLINENNYMKMKKAVNPYGDGKSSRRIIEALKYYFKLTKIRPNNW